MMNSLAKDLGKSLSNNMAPALMNFIENEFDSIVESNILKNVPILEAIAGVIRVGKDLHEQNLLQQTTVFLFEFNSGTIDEEKLKKYKKKIQSDKKKQKELERVLLILNNNIDLEKSKILARLFAAYINEKISWDSFCEYTDITDRLFLEDFRLLEALWRDTNCIEKSGDKFRIERIYSAGVIGVNNFVMAEGSWGIGERCLNVLGKEYCDIIFTKGGKK